MSLQVWLPLTKDLRQQGLSDVTVTNNGATYSATGGKLGGCYKFTSSGNNLSIPANAMNNFTASNGCSLAFWIKLNTWYSSYATFFQAGTGSSPWSNYIFGVLRNASNSTVCFTIGNGSSASQNSYLTSAWETGVWFHMAFTYETGKCKIYKNGVLDKEYTTSIVPDFSKITKITVGRCNNETTYHTDCEMNDIRIYNHCLSPMEVKQISQGLVLHYPLSSADLINRSTITHGYYLGSNGAEGGDNGWCHTDYIGLIPNSSYIGMGLSVGGVNTYAALYNKDKVLTRTVLLTANQNLLITTSDTEYFIRLSIRKYANELNTAKFLYVGTIEYDCSGFCNNGVHNGTFSWTNDTPKYSVSSVCSGSNYISLASPPTSVETIAVWAKWNTIPSGQSVILVDNGSGIGLGLMSTGILCSTSKAGNSYTFSKANLVANTWYHFVIVKTGTTTRKLYINGVEQTATSNVSNWTYSVNQLQLGKRSTTSDGFIGKLCDFRAYATALSADDVKSLYQNCATIDPDGTIRGQIRS